MFRSAGIFWKKTPLLRLLLPFTGGILMQWYLSLAASLPWALAIVSFLLLMGFFILDSYRKFRWGMAAGIVAMFLFIAMGMLVTRSKDIRNQSRWFGHHYRPPNMLQVCLEEPPEEKPRSYKAIARVERILSPGSSIPATGRVILYFDKEQSPEIGYGNTILVSSPMQPIRNAGNPGGFDYRRYCLFQGITHQVFLRRGDFLILPQTTRSRLWSFLYRTREQVLFLLQKHIQGPREAGLAEALLIGYKNDLDKELVQSYAQTGVVHVIAISGMHLGLIYWLLALLLKPLERKKKGKAFRGLLIITGLWLFSLLAGAQPSILRAAFMFTCLVLGESLSRPTSVFNTLALSAFGLLLINPFWLWDAGFQLSYAAVISIVVFMRPIYNLLTVSNRLLDQIWKLNAVTLAAQVLTVPVSLYHFHQFPNYFLLTNLVAVPLSSLILLAEILLCGFAFVPVIAASIGWFCGLLLKWMNRYITCVADLPGATWNGIMVSAAQAILLYLFIFFVYRWLKGKSPRSLQMALCLLLGFAILHVESVLRHRNIKQVIVYHIPGKRAIDFVAGPSCLFAGDSSVTADIFANDFHLKPARISLRTKPEYHLPGMERSGPFIFFAGKKLLWAEDPIVLSPLPYKIGIDLLLVSGKSRLRLEHIASACRIRQVVADGSVPRWKLKMLETAADSLGIPFHDVSTRGAFVMRAR